MKKLNVKEYNLDYIMENYFNTNKGVMFLCDYKTAWDILKYSEYSKDDFENYFSVELDCEYPYYSVFKCEDSDFIIEFLTNKDGELYDEYIADNILVQDSVLDEYGDNILEKCYANDALSLIGDYEFVDLENLKSLEENYVDDLSNEQCDCCKCCDECCEEEKDEVLDQIYQQGVKDTFKVIGKLLKQSYIK
ncbi:hypothetical protein IRP63_14870 (plasmid) [Clostridium botulinum]|uniref:Uncharacterized protein n=1 Tax=Clostridium botulinum C/D str. DC5 TaxID=1443128 RepID=A0A0A0HZ62_CLOBO|nr:hypothetical protein [Clostridium botulinum]KGM93371.1 hypothetical protein Z955_15495 [Clostridium botulinum C/D str. DC5]KOC56945.1 hypothetical protein ADU89_01775 [Clostridium botulinum]KOC57420.1 hypothetical protein ADU90_06315 [Clostridium botulinum]MCD3232661.1 hypothetical protein [Clostridium botulinum D/C]MCD3238410.1 hypothetical protein [Clostridium botulinum D/C]